MLGLDRNLNVDVVLYGLVNQYDPRGSSGRVKFLMDAILPLFDQLVSDNVLNTCLVIKTDRVLVDAVRIGLLNLKLSAALNYGTPPLLMVESPFLVEVDPEFSLGIVLDAGVRLIVESVESS